MKIMAFNGSPRKKHNTATLLQKALEGAASRGANTELINLYDLFYKGCISCFACKTKGGKSYGKCAVEDDLTAIFREVEKADAIILGSPIYYGTVSGEMKSFMERLLFPYTEYTVTYSSLFPRKIKAGFIYAMNVPEELMLELGYEQQFKLHQATLKRILGASEYICSFDTYQFDEYSKYVSSRFDPEKKLQRHKEIFPQDCEKAFEMGVRLTEAVG
jgi:multimeric flavodoxin WrbA